MSQLHTNAIIQKINKLLSIATFGEHSLMNLSEGAGIKVMGLGESAVSFISLEVVAIYLDTLNFMYHQINDINEYYSIEYFEEKLAELLRIIHAEERKCNNNDWIKLFDNLKNEPIHFFYIFTFIYGIEMKIWKVVLGDFSIYKTPSLNPVLKSEHPDFLPEEWDDPSVISVKIKAKERIKAKQLAYKAFNIFENVSNFITGTFHNNSRISLFINHKPQFYVSFVLGPGLARKSIERTQILRTINIDWQVFNFEKLGHDRIWAWVTSDKNPLQQKILESIEWCGKAIIEPDPAKAILQYIISIECLLHTQENEMIAPSIVSKLCDMISFLLADNYRERIAIVKYLRDLYELRSAITHGRTNSISDVHLHTALVFCTRIINKVITEKPYSDFLTKETLSKYLLNLKYGKPEK